MPTVEVRVEARTKNHNRLRNPAPLSPARGRGLGEGATRPGLGNNHEPRPATVATQAGSNAGAEAANGRPHAVDTKTVHTPPTRIPRRADTTVGDLDSMALFGYKVR